MTNKPWFKSIKFADPDDGEAAGWIVDIHASDHKNKMNHVGCAVSGI